MLKLPVYHRKSRSRRHGRRASAHRTVASNLVIIMAFLLSLVVGSWGTYIYMSATYVYLNKNTQETKRDGQKMPMVHHAVELKKNETAKSKNIGVGDADIIKDLVIENYLPKGKRSSEVEQVVVVNLPYRGSNWNGMLHALIESRLLQSMPITRMLAVVGKDADLLDLHDRSMLGDKAYRSLISPRLVGGHYMTRGGLGCLMSHIEVWREAVHLNKPTIVFEDDIMLVKGFDAKFQKVLKDIPDDMGLFYFADLVNSTLSRNSAFDYNPASSMTLLKHGEHWGTYAYMISPTAAKILLDNVYPMNFQVDSYMIQTCADFEIAVYRSKTNLVYTDNSNDRKSDVQETIKQTKIAIPLTVHLLDISPYHRHIKAEVKKYTRDAKRLSTLKVEYWDASRIQNLHEQYTLDESAPEYMLEVLCVKVAILQENGGLIKDHELAPKISLKKFVKNISGVFTYQYSEQTGQYTYPLIASISNNPELKKIHACLQTLLKDARAYRQTKQKPLSIASKGLPTIAHECITKNTERFPIMNTIITFPSSILAASDY